MQKSENQLAVELIRYYQQKEALTTQKEDYKKLNNLFGFNNTMLHYNETIVKLRKLLNESNPKRLEEIDIKRANDCTVTGAVEIGSQSQSHC